MTQLLERAAMGDFWGDIASQRVARAMSLVRICCLRTSKTKLTVSKLSVKFVVGVRVASLHTQIILQRRQVVHTEPRSLQFLCLTLKHLRK